MPLLPEQTDNILPNLIREPIVDDNNEIVPEMTKTFGAAFRLDNTVGAFLSNKSRGNGVFDPNFDWGDNFRKLPIGYQLDYGNAFALAENKEHFDAIKENIDQRLSDRQYLAESGWLGVAAEFANGLFLEPMNLVPIGGIALKVGKGAKSVLEGSAKIAMAGAAATTVQELALHSQDQTRTFGESAANVSVGALLSGVLGAAMYRSVSANPNYSKLTADLEKDFKLEGTISTKQPFYHGTTSDFEQFDSSLLGSNTGAQSAKEGFFFSPNPKVAETYANRGKTFKALSEEEYEEQVSLVGLQRSIASNPSSVSDSLKDYFKNEGLARLSELNARVDAQPSYVKKVSLEYKNPKTVDLQGAKRKSGDYTKLIKEAKTQGYDALIIKNTRDTPSLEAELNNQLDDIVVVFDEKQITPFEEPTDQFGWSGGPVFNKPKEPVDTSLNAEGLASAKGLEKIFGFQDPGLRLIQSEAKNSRVAVQNLAEISGKLNKNFEGIRTPTSVESLKKIDDGRLASSIQFGREQYVNYRKRLGADGARDRLTYSEFMEAVGKAGRRNDVSDIPEVAKVAADRRQNIYNYYRDEAKKIKGMLEDDDLVNTAPSYVNRIYNREKVVQNSEDFMNRTMKYLRDNDVFTQASSVKNNNRLQDALDFADTSEYMNAAQDIKRNIVGARSNIIHDRLGMSVQPKFTKSRKFLIKDEDIEDFLESNSDHLISQYARAMSSRIRLSQKFGMEFLDDDFTQAKSGIVKSIRDDYAKLQREFKSDPKKLDALHKAEESDVNDVLALRDRLIGSYGYTSNPDSWLYRFQKQVKQINVLRLLGDLVTSAIPDLGKLVYVSGFTKMFSQGVIPLVTKLRSPEMRAYLKQNAKEIRNMGTALDLLTQSRANSINDIVDDFGRHTKAERAVDYLGGKFQKVTGIGYWNSTLKTVAATLVQTNMSEAMTKVLAGTATKREIADLAAGGIDKEFAKVIKQQIAKHGEEVEGLIMPNIAAWDEGTLEAAEAYAGAVAKAADAIIVTPGVSTTPLWMSRQGLNLMGQFKSFAFSSVQKTMIPMMQDFDSKTVQALVTMGALGTLTAVIKRTVSDQEIPDTNTLIMEGVDRSGVLGWTMDANNMLEKITNGNLGLSKIAGSQSMSRYAQRGRVESVLGPSAALLSDAMVISGDLAGGDLRKSTTHRIRKMIPFQTLMGVRQTLDLLEEEVNNSMGITKK